MEEGAERQVLEAERWWDDLSKRSREAMWSSGRWWREMSNAQAFIDSAFISVNATVGARYWATHKARYLSAQVGILKKQHLKIDPPHESSICAPNASVDQLRLCRAINRRVHSLTGVFLRATTLSLATAP